MEDHKYLREQMTLMKRSLDKYEIVNDRLMRTVMRQRSKWISNLFIIECITLPLLILFVLDLSEDLAISIWPSVALGVFGFISILFDYKTLRISPKMINDCNLLTLRTKLIQQKSWRSIQVAIELPMSLLWGIWFLLSFFHSEKLFDDLIDSRIFNWIQVISISVFIIVSIVVVLLLLRKLQQTNDSLIDDIDTSERDPG